MKENKKAVLDILQKKSSKKDGKFENLVLNLALQKIDSDNFEYDGDAVYSSDKKRLVYCMSQATSFTVPEGVTVIGEMAFRSKKQLKNIIFSSTVKEIEHDAFYDCDELDNVYIPANVKEIKGYAFAECDKLKRITFAGVPNKLSRHTFDDCDQLHDIIVPAGTAKEFRKALHFIDGDTDFLVLESPVQKEEKKGDDSDKKNPTDKKNPIDKKAEKKDAADKKEEKKKSVDKKVEKKDSTEKKEDNKKSEKKAAKA